MAALPPGKTKVSGISQRFVVNGIIDLKQLYDAVTAWYVAKHYTYSEDEMTTKRKAKGDELKMKLNGDRKVTDYVQYFIKILVLATFLEKVEVEGKMVSKGLVEVRIESYMVLDYYKKFQRSKMGKFLQFIYHNYLMKEKIELLYWQNLYDESMELFNQMKEAVQLETFA